MTGGLTTFDVRDIGPSIGRAAFALLDLVWPKERGLIVFGHRDFTDNSRALFEHLARAGGPLRAAWLCDGEAQAAAIAAAVPGACVALKRSWRGLGLALRARAVALSFYPEEFLPFSLASRRKRVVMLWHAISIKRSKLLNPLLDDGARRRRARAASRYALMIASSDVDRLAKAAAHGVDARRVAVTGLPRSDRLARPPALAAALAPAIARAPAARIVLHVPTHRARGAATDFLPFADADPARLDAFLAAHDAIMLLRPHKNDRAARERLGAWARAGYRRLVPAGADAVPDVADLLGRADVLVTDHSSIFLDFLLLDRPMVFVPHEPGAFGSARGLLYDYRTITPGPKVLSQAAFERALADAFAGAPEHAAHRGWARAMFHAHVAGGASARVAAEIARLLALDAPAAARRPAAAPPPRSLPA